MDYQKRKYYVNTEMDADREIHREDCIHLPPPPGRKYLGEFYSPMAAVAAALKVYPLAYSCKTCNQAQAV